LTRPVRFASCYPTLTAKSAVRMGHPNSVVLALLDNSSVPVDPGFPRAEAEGGGVGLGGRWERQVEEDQFAGLYPARQRVRLWGAAEVEDDEESLLAQGAGVGADVLVGWVQVLVIAVDQGLVRMAQVFCVKW